MTFFPHVNYPHKKDVIKEFERNYNELSVEVTEKGQANFAQLREMENDFHERLTETVVASYERLTKGDLDELADEIRDVRRSICANMFHILHN